MVFQVPPSKASLGEDKFEFEIEGKKFSVTKYNCLTVAQQIELAAADVEGVIDLVFGAVGSKAGDAVRRLEDNQFDALTEGWRQDSEVTPGESRASSS